MAENHRQTYRCNINLLGELNIVMLRFDGRKFERNG